jgi:hypothetical protein
MTKYHIALSQESRVTLKRLSRLYGCTEAHVVRVLLAFREEYWLKALNDIERDKYFHEEIENAEAKAAARRYKTRLTSRIEQANT